MAFLCPPPILTSRTPLRRRSCSSSKARAYRIAPRAVLHKAKQVSAEQLESILQANERPVLVDAFAKWCGPCQFLLPQLDLVAEKFGERLDILKFDTEEYPDLATALMIRGLPTLFFIKDGSLQYKMEGALTADELAKLVDYVLFDGPRPNEIDGVPRAE